MKGFTLIEVIVAISVTLIVMGLVLVNYNSYNDTQTLKQSALTLKNNIRLAQSKAYSGEKPLSDSCDKLAGYRVSFASDKYSLQAECLPQGLIIGTTTEISFPSGVVLNPVPTSLLYRVLARGTDLAAPLCITLTGSGRTYKLRIDTNGDINDLGLQYAGACP